MFTDITISEVKNFVRYAELIAAVTGTIYYYKYRNTDLKKFLWLLWIITCVEFAGYYTLKYDFLIHTDANGVKYNLWLYNLLDIIFFPLLYHIYNRELYNIVYKFWVIIFFVVFILVNIVNWIFIQNFITEWSEIPYLFGSLTLTVTIILYFIELLKSDRIITFHKSLFFWVSVGLLLFHAGTIPFAAKINGYAMIPGIHNLFLIMYILAIAMYMVFTFGFIWSKKE